MDPQAYNGLSNYWQLRIEIFIVFFNKLIYSINPGSTVSE